MECVSSNATFPPPLAINLGAILFSGEKKYMYPNPWAAVALAAMQSLSGSGSTSWSALRVKTSGGFLELPCIK